MTLNTLGMDLLPLSDAHQLNFELNDLEWAGSTSQAGFSASTELCSAARDLASPASVSHCSHSSLEDPVGTACPANWGVQILTWLSKKRDQPGEERSAASADGSDLACHTSSAQDRSQEVAPPPQHCDKASKQREKNKRAQQRHRTKQKAKEEETSAQIAVLAAELKQMRWEKNLIEQQAETLKTALAVFTGPPSEAAAVAQSGMKTQYWPSSGWIPQAVMTNTLHAGSPQLMTAEQVKAMTIGDHRCLWRMLVFTLANLLPAMQGRIDSPAGVRLKELMVEHGMRVACVASFNPDCLHELMISNMETGGPAGPTTTDNWRAIAASAQLTDAQRRQILLVRRHYYQQLGVIASSRCKVAPWVQTQGVHSGNYSGLADQFVTSRTALRQLQELMVQEQNLLISLLGAVWRRTITTTQTAIMTIQSYPLAVDLVAVINCLAEDMGEPSSAELMASKCSFVLDSSALRVPSPDLLLEVSQWSVDYPAHSA